MTAGEFWSHPLVVSLTAAAIMSACAGVTVAIRLMFQVKGILVGPDGENGLRSEVRKLLVRMDEMGDEVNDLTHRVERIEETRPIRPTNRRRPNHHG